MDFGENKKVVSKALFKKVSGRCACGGVSYEVDGPLRQIVACHCEQCRRTSGHFVAATATRRRYFTLLEQRGLTWFEAVPGFRRGFCNQCGSSLFFEELGGERISIAAGSLDNSEGLMISAHIYASERGSYYSINDDVEISQLAVHCVPLP